MINLIKAVIIANIPIINVIYLWMTLNDKDILKDVIEDLETEE